jgi:putative endonuclease
MRRATRLGPEAERRVRLHYRLRGYRVLAANVSAGGNELDIVLRRGRLLVFCEVKARSGAAFGGGYEAVTWTKRRTLRRLAELFVQQHSISSDEIRFDVASVWIGRGVPDVEVFEDAF